MEVEKIVSRMRSAGKRAKSFRINEFLLKKMEKDALKKKLNQTAYIEHLLLAAIVSESSRTSKEFSVNFRDLKKWLS